MDAANHIRKAKVALNTSEDSIMSFESVNSTGCRSAVKHKVSKLSSIVIIKCHLSWNVFYFILWCQSCLANAANMTLLIVCFWCAIIKPRCFICCQLSEGQNDDPIVTVIAFTDRTKSKTSTELELAKLHNYVKNMPDSEKQKQLYMKRVCMPSYHFYIFGHSSCSLFELPLALLLVS